MNINQLKIIGIFFIIAYITFFGIAVWIYLDKDSSLGLNLIFDLFLVFLTYGIISFVLEFNKKSRIEKIKDIAKKILDRDFWDIDNYLSTGYIGEFKGDKYHLNEDVFLKSNAINALQRIIGRLDSFRMFLEYFDPNVIDNFIDIQKNFDIILRHSIHLIEGPTIAFISKKDSIKIIELRISKIKRAMDLITEKESLPYSSLAKKEW